MVELALEEALAVFAAKQEVVFADQVSVRRSACQTDWLYIFLSVNLLFIICIRSVICNDVADKIIVCKPFYHMPPRPSQIVHLVA